MERHQQDVSLMRYAVEYFEQRINRDLTILRNGLSDADIANPNNIYNMTVLLYGELSTISKFSLCTESGWDTYLEVVSTELYKKAVERYLNFMIEISTMLMVELNQLTPNGYNLLVDDLVSALSDVRKTELLDASIVDRIMENGLRDPIRLTAYLFIEAMTIVNYKISVGSLHGNATSSTN